MLENFYLTYANNSLKENPNNIFLIINELKKYWGKLYNGSNLETIEILLETLGKFIVLFLKVDDLQSALKLKNEVDETDNYFGVDWVKGWEWLPEMALDALYLYRRDLHCFYAESFPINHENWICSANSKYILKDIFLRNKIQIDCYECFRLRFRKILSEIIAGKSYNDINDLFKYFNSAYDNIITKVVSTEKNKLKTIQYISSDLLFDEDAERESPYEHMFNYYISSLVGFSMAQFFINNDLRKLKYCPYCHRFYISKNINRKTSCYSKDCERSYQRDKKRIQREKEPEIYY